MLTAQGIGVFADIVIGQLVFYERQIFKVHKEQVEDITREMMPGSYFAPDSAAGSFSGKCSDLSGTSHAAGGYGL